MTWEEDLFGVLDDLEQQAEALYDAERQLDLADRSRAEYQQVTLASRLMASAQTAVTLDVVGVGPVRGQLQRVGAQWCLVTGGDDWVVHLPAVAGVREASTRAVPEVAWSPIAALGLGSALRRLAEAQARCLVHRTDGGRHDGVLERVGQDFVEVREGEGAGRVVLVAFAALAAVQSRD